MEALYNQYGLTLFDDMTEEDWADGNAFKDIFN